MKLSEVIAFLESVDKSIIVPCGFHNPHSYRGHYRHLGVEIKNNVSVSDMLKCLNAALDNTYTGWKGGEYVMCGNVDIYLVQAEGKLGEMIGDVLLGYMVGIPVYK